MRVFGVETLGVHGGLQVLDRSFYSALAAQADLSVVWVTCDENTATDPGYELWTPFQGIYGSDAMWRRGFRYAQGYRRLLRRAVAEARDGPVVIHQQFITFPALELAFMRAAQRRGIGWVSTPHESAMHHDPSRTGRLIGRMCRASDALIALSTANLESLKRIVLGSGPPISLIELGHLNNFRGDVPWLDQGLARARLGLPPDARIVLFQGEVRPVKGVEFLIRAFPEVLRRISSAYLVIAGLPHGTDAVGLRDLVHELGIEPRTRLDLRFVPDDEVGQYFRAADVVALPYVAAAQSAACFTAYAYRRPVVASAVGGLVEQVKEGETGLLVEPKNSLALAGGLIELLESLTRANAMGDTAREWANGS